MEVINDTTAVSDLIEIARHQLDELEALEAEYAGHVRLELWLEQKRKSISSLLSKIDDESCKTNEQWEAITYLANLLKRLRCRLEALQADKEPAWARGLITPTSSVVTKEALENLVKTFSKPRRH